MSNRSPPNQALHLTRAAKPAPLAGELGRYAREITPTLLVAVPNGILIATFGAAPNLILSRFDDASILVASVASLYAQVAKLL